MDPENRGSDSTPDRGKFNPVGSIPGMRTFSKADGGTVDLYANPENGLNRLYSEAFLSLRDMLNEFCEAVVHDDAEDLSRLRLSPSFTAYQPPDSPEYQYALNLQHRIIQDLIREDIRIHYGDGPYVPTHEAFVGGNPHYEGVDVDVDPGALALANTLAEEANQAVRTFLEGKSSFGDLIADIIACMHSVSQLTTPKRSFSQDMLELHANYDRAVEELRWLTAVRVDHAIAQTPQSDEVVNGLDLQIGALQKGLSEMRLAL